MAGGGGWYGGGASYGNGAGGGSGWIFTETNYNAGYTSSTYTGGVWNLNTQYFLSEDSYTIPGNATMPNPAGGNMTGKSGNGYARITLIEEEQNIITLTLNGEEEVDVKLGNVYTDAGATLMKNDVDISNQIEITGSVDVNKLGEYIITYSYYDVETNQTYSISRTVTVIPITFKIDYTGNVKEFIVPVTGKYLLEVWGADGGAVTTSTMNSRGGYSKGIVELAEGEILYVYVGGKGEELATNNYTNKGGFNGGGSAKNSSGSGSARTGGGGASDIRVLQDSLYNRIIVSGGGAGNSAHSSDMKAGNGGGSTGASGQFGAGGSQTAGGNGQVSGGISAGFGIGGSEVNSTVGGGGGGWYGGGNGNGGGRRFWICINRNIC